MKRILVLVGAYLPAFKVGGPVRSIYNLIASLKDEFEFSVVCWDRDIGDDRPLENQVIGEWSWEGDCRIFRLPESPIGLMRLIGLLRSPDYDLLYLNGFLDRKLTMLPLLLRRLRLICPRPILLVARGECSAGALGIRGLRKRVYLRVAESLGLFRATVIQSASEAEARDILSLLASINIVNARTIPSAGSRQTLTPSLLTAADVPDRVDSVSSHSIPPKTAGTLRLVTVARISQMKNLEFAIQLLFNIRGELHYDIFGPFEDRSYYQRCCELASSLPPNASVCFRGEIENSRIKDLLPQYHLFFLPTLGENYCHSIVEALSVGRPVLISDRTPWRGLAHSGVGWDLPLEAPKAFEAALQEAVDWSSEDFRARIDGVISTAATLLQREQAIQQNREILLLALSQH